MKSNSIACYGVILAISVVGCASEPIVLSPVGPGLVGQSAQAQKDSKGYLQVFSAREKSVEFGFNTYFYPHTGYDINDATGNSVCYVPNHLSDMDERPDKVTLPAGSYQIIAKSTWCGQVTIPVVIENGNTTVVHLDNDWWPSSNASSSQLVHLPNGEAVGWTASAGK